MHSMTGFGQASWEGGGRRLSVEIRSVNQRFLDVRFNLPREGQGWEEELRHSVAAAVQRGKVDVIVNRSGSPAGAFEVEFNEPLARATVKAWRHLQRQLHLPGEIDVGFFVGRNEFVRVVERRHDPQADLPRIRQLLKLALRRFNLSREREGRALARDMLGRLGKLNRIERRLRKRTAVLVPELARRLGERVAQLIGDQKLGEERLLQETALLAERADVTEELVRLRSHLDRLAHLLRQRGPVGKAIDFLLQEIHREVNTTASKSADLEVTNLTLEARSEIEKLKEQTQNVE